MTEDLTANIALYHNLFFVCLILFFISLAVTIILFFVLDITDVIAYLTGRKAKKQIQQLEKDSAKSKPIQVGEYQNIQYMEQSKPQEVTEQLDGNQEDFLQRLHGVIGMFEIEKEIILIHTEEMI